MNWYQEGARRTLDHDYSNLTPIEVELLLLASGACGEVGELYNKLKKGIVHKHGYTAKEIEEEIGDVFWYLTGLATRLGLNIEQIMLENIIKLEKRYPTGFDINRSINREEDEEDE